MEAYKIAVHLAMTSNAPSFLSALSSQLLGVNAKAKDLEGSLNRVKVALAGGFMMAGGVGLLKLFSDLADKGSEIVHQLELMKGVGMKAGEIQGARSFGFQVSKAVPNVSVAEALRHLTELRYAFGDLETAKKYAIPLERSNAILESVKPGSSDQVWEMVKALEQKGLTLKPDEFMSYVNTMTKVVQASLGKVDPQAFFQAFKYGRTAMLGWDEEFVGQYLPRLIQSMSGGGGSGSGTGGPGNALMSAFAKVVQGQMPKKAAQEFDRLGLTTSFKDIKGSSAAQADIVGASLFAKNPYAWVQTVLMPAMAKHGITDQNDVIQEISRLFPVRTASQVIGEMALQGKFREGEHSPFEKDAALQRGALGLNAAYGEYSKNDPVLVAKQYAAQWNSMMQAMGEAMTPMKMEMMKNLTSVFQAIASFSNSHPEAMKIIADGLVILGAALVGAGAAAIIAALAAGGWFVGGIIALGAALGALFAVLAGVDWKAIIGSVTNAFNAIIDAIKSFVSAIAHGLNLGAGAPHPQGGMGTDGLPLIPLPRAGKQGSLHIGPPSKYGMNDNHTHIYLDGEKVGAAVTRRQVASAQFPNAIGGVDTYGSWTSPGTGLIDAA
jgi:hypothetical protein